MAQTFRFFGFNYDKLPREIGHHGTEVKRLLLPVRLVGVPEFPKTTIWEGKSWKLLDERDEVLAFLGMAKEYP